MHILLVIWKQFKNFIVFLFLEVIAIGILLSSNPYQNSYFFQVTTSLRSNFLESFSLWGDYFSLYQENRNLIEENARLTERLKNTAPPNTDANDLESGKYNYIPAKVAYSSIGTSSNYLVINQGRKNGIKPEMAVVSSQGLVGIVYAVSEDYASVIPMINKDFSCLVTVNDYTLDASTSWDSEDYRYTNVKGVPLHLSIKKNDSVFTNSNSTLYPSHELIGTVADIKKGDLGKYYELKVKLATNFANLKNVYAIENKDKQQIDSLQNNE